MDLLSAPGWFHTESFTNLSGAGGFLGLMSEYSGAVERRVLEVAPGVSLPADKTVIDVASGQKFVLGLVSNDWWAGSSIAKLMPAVPVSSLFSIQTIAQVLAVAAGGSVYGHLSYLRRLGLVESSDFYNEFEFIFPSSSVLSAGQIISSGGKWYRVRIASHEDDAGFGSAEVVELPSPLLLAQAVITNALNPATDVVTPTTYSANIFVEPFELDYFHQVLGFVGAGPGDQAVSILKSAVATITRGDKIGSHGLVMAVRDGGTVWTSMVRRNSA